MKWVKQRASTVNRRREIEMVLERGREERERVSGPGSGVGEEDAMQGLYAESQTELYKPEQIVDVCYAFAFLSLPVNIHHVIQGKIRKNDFGNIDLYVPSMLPPGGAHIPCEYHVAIV